MLVMECWYCGSKKITKNIIGIGSGMAVEHVCEECGTVQDGVEPYDCT